MMLISLAKQIVVELFSSEMFIQIELLIKASSRSPRYRAKITVNWSAIFKLPANRTTLVHRLNKGVSAN